MCNERLRAKNEWKYVILTKFYTQGVLYSIIGELKSPLGAGS